jgi:hypothetical protein
MPRFLLRDVEVKMRRKATRSLSVKLREMPPAAVAAGGMVSVSCSRCRRVLVAAGQSCRWGCGPATRPAPSADDAPGLPPRWLRGTRTMPDGSHVHLRVDRRVRRPVLSLRHCHGYAADIHRGLQTGSHIPAKEFLDHPEVAGARPGRPILDLGAYPRLRPGRECILGPEPRSGGVRCGSGAMVRWGASVPRCTA